jgi:PAS domain S-box-containing protein
MQLIAQRVPNLLLLDVGMPDKDGLAFCRELKKDPRLTDIPVLMMSGHISTTDVERGIAAGALDYIKKPFDHDELRFRIRTHLRLREMQEQRDKDRARLLAITSAAKDAIIQINSRGEITLWNQSATSLFGYDAGEALGQRIHDIIAPQRFSAKHYEGFSRFASTGQGDVLGRPLELTARNKAGVEFLIELSLSAVAIDGEWHAVGICRNISERKQAEARLQQSEARFRTSFENASVGQAVATPDGRFVDVNRTLSIMLGYSEAELRGKTFVELTHPEDLNESLEAERDLLERSVSVSGRQKRYLRKDGSIVWADVSVTATRDADGNVLQFNAHVIDITDRKRVEEERARSETKFRTLYESSLDAVMLLDGHGIFDCNEATVRMFGCKTKQALYAKHPADLSPEFQLCGTSSVTLASQRIATAVELGSARFEWVHRRVDSDEEFPAEVLLSRMILDGRIVLQATVRDISERKRAEAILQAEIAQRQQVELELRQAHKLEAVGQLAAGIAHEINTPSQWVSDNVAFLEKAFQLFTSVIDAALRVANECDAQDVQLPALESLRQLISRSKLERVIKELPRAIEQSQEGLRRISSIVIAMKEFSHPSTGRRQATDINAALRTTVTVARNEWKYVADISFDLAPELPTVPALKDELNQVFLNLIVNAAHAIGDVKKVDAQEKGTITLTTRVNGPWLEIRIRDTGAGIPPQIQTRIFEPFFTTKPVGKGTGQGLAIAHTVVVDKHKGRLFFETEVDRGTTFVIQLPLQSESTSPSGEAS